jgi:hypothetical protein
VNWLLYTEASTVKPFYPILVEVLVYKRFP